MQLGTSIKLRVFFAALSAALLGAIAFFAVRIALPGSGEARAQPGQPPSGDVHRKVAEDEAKPKFVGTLNGIRFYTGNDAPQPPPQCKASPGRNSTKAEIDASPLNFSPGYLPDNSS